MRAKKNPQSIDLMSLTNDRWYDIMDHRTNMQSSTNQQYLIKNDYNFTIWYDSFMFITEDELRESRLNTVLE